VCPPLGVGRTSIRCCDRVLLNRRCRPLPLFRSGGAGPRGVWETEWSTRASELRRPSECADASTAA
jgi:hypothetical protein